MSENNTTQNLDHLSDEETARILNDDRVSQDNQNPIIADIAEQIATIEPAAGDAGRSGGARNGYGFHSDIEDLAGDSDLFALLNAQGSLIGVDTDNDDDFVSLRESDPVVTVLSSPAAEEEFNDQDNQGPIDQDEPSNNNLPDDQDDQDDQDGGDDNPGDQDSDVIVSDLPLELQAIISNETTNQRFIDSTQGYELPVGCLGRSQRVNGDELDLPGVSDSAEITYRFRGDDRFDATLRSDWNSVKNIEVAYAEAGRITLKNFVQADVTLSGDGNSRVTIHDAKRGFVETGEGNDRVSIRALTNDSNWGNEFDVQTGGGNDRITVTGDKFYTQADIDAGSGNDRVNMRGDYEWSQVALGDGDDRFTGRDGVDIVSGGNGRDNINTGRGHDVIFGGSDNDTVNGGAGGLTMARLDEALANEGNITIDYGGSDTRLTSMGVQDGGQVLRFRNGSDEAIEVTFRGAGTDFEETYTVAANSEFFLQTPYANATYIAREEGGKQHTKASNPNEFSYSLRVETESNADIVVLRGSLDEYVITRRGGRFTIEDTVEDRDGVDVVRGVEGILFGLEDLYSSLVENGQVNDLGPAGEIGLSDLLEQYSPLQNAINDFVRNPASESFDVPEGGQPESATFAIYDIASAHEYSEANGAVI